MQSSLRFPCFEIGKLQRQSSYATLDSGPKISRLYITDKSSNKNFLIDTGADISVVPPTSQEKKNAPCKFQLFAANGSQIKTYGSKSITLNLGLRRPIRWIFVIADVQSPIIGSDLLKKHDLLIDFKNSKITDNLSNISVNTIVVSQKLDAPSIRALSSITVYHQLIHEFPDILDVSSIKSSFKKHNVQHRIVTNCQPLFSKARRLSPDKLKFAKAEFNKMLELGICRPSDSPWAYGNESIW